jgi:hypothetical protein
MKQDFQGKNEKLKQFYPTEVIKMHPENAFNEDFSVVFFPPHALVFFRIRWHSFLQQTPMHLHSVSARAHGSLWYILTEVSEPTYHCRT